MNKFWNIGTGTYTYIKLFSKISINNDLKPGDSIILYENNSKFDLIKNKEVIKEFYSSSTANQYIKAWISLGFIYKYREAEFKIATLLKEEEELKELANIFITKKSNDKVINKFRKSTIIKILALSNSINNFDLRNKNVLKGKEIVTVEYIKKTISRYEREVIHKKDLMKKIKEYYDKQF